jgi:PhnB protein
MRIGDSLIFLSDEGPNGASDFRAPSTLGGTSFALYLLVAEADAACERAVRAGAEIVFPVQRQHWGSREGLVRDPFGHLWALSAPPKQE